MCKPYTNAIIKKTKYTRKCWNAIKTGPTVSYFCGYIKGTQSQTAVYQLFMDH